MPRSVAAQQGLLQRATIAIEQEAQRRRESRANKRSNCQRTAHELAQHQREQRVATGDRAVEIEYGDASWCRRC